MFLLHLSGACFGTYVIICCATIRSADSEALEGVPPCGVVCLCSGYRAYTPVCTAVKSTQCSQTDNESLRAESAAVMPSCRMCAAFQVRSHATANCSGALSSCGMMCHSVMWGGCGQWTVHIPQPVEQTKSAQRSRFAELGCQVLLVVHHSAIGLVHMLSYGATQRSVMLRVLCHSVMWRGFGCLVE